MANAFHVTISVNSSLRGNNVCLSSDILTALVNQHQDGWDKSLVFCVETNEHTTHCGVQDFTADGKSHMVISPTLDRQLESTICKITLVQDIPVMTYLKLTPQHYHFYRLHDPKRTLEDILSMNYKVLTVGDCIDVEYMRQTYKVLVDEIRPETSRMAASLIGAHVDLDFNPSNIPEPERHMIKIDPEEDANAEWHMNILPQSCKFLVIKTVVPDGVNLMNVVLDIRLMDSSYPNNPIRMYASASEKYPNKHSYSWMNHQSITIGRAKGVYNIAIFNEDEHQSNDVHLKIDLVITNENKQKPLSNDMYTCVSCNRLIPTTSRDLHNLRCGQNTIVCQKCNKSIRKDRIARHVRLFHAMVKCSKCGDEMETQYLEGHDLRRCLYRQVRCRWCHTPMQRIDQEAHESECGNRSVTCTLCQDRVIRKRVGLHLANTHQVNPCTDDGDKYIQSILYG
jgi:hypothetical protein